MKQHINKTILGVFVLALLVFAFLYGGAAPGLQGVSPESEKVGTIQNVEFAKEPFVESEKEVGDIRSNEKGNVTEENKPQKKDGTPMTPEEKLALAEEIVARNQGTDEVQNESETSQSLVEDTIDVEDTQTAEREQNIHSYENCSSEEVRKNNEEYSEEQGMEIDEETGKDKFLTEPVPEGKPVPVEPENAVITERKLFCTLSVRCDTILDNIGWLDEEKIEIVPKDGAIFAEKKVEFQEGESVFDLLLREMKANKIHMEFEHTPIYNSAYIEGIGNLYEFDCGELSGWMYKVNGWFPNYGCSRYQLRAGDKVEWVYTCNLGVDVGGYYAASGN